MSGELLSKKMKLEHGKMLKLLDDFGKGKKDSYEKLKDMQNRHASAEEQAIMIFYKDKKDFKLLRTILEQHETMRGYIGEINTNPVIAKKFVDLMKDHIKLEDAKFYPMLDKDLTPVEQKEIFANFLYLFGQRVQSV